MNALVLCFSPATYQDVIDAPPNMVAEILPEVGGNFTASARSKAAH